MAHEIEQSSGNLRVPGLIPGSSRESVKVSLSKTESLTAPDGQLSTLHSSRCHQCVHW